MQHIPVRIGPLPARIMGRIRPQDVVEDNEMVIAQVLSRLHKVANGFGIGADFGLWKDNTKLHRLPPLPHHEHPSPS